MSDTSQHQDEGGNRRRGKLTAKHMYKNNQGDEKIALQIQNNPLPKPKIPDQYPPSEIRWATEYYVSTRWQNIAPSVKSELKDSFTTTVRELAMPHFMENIFSEDIKKQTDQKYFLMLADSGMGKTTFMINLFQKWNRRPRHKIMRLFHIADYKTWHYIERIKDLGKASDTILLLDAFDEDELAMGNYKNRLSDIISFTQDFYKVIITSRTQFFPNSDTIVTQTNIPTDQGFQELSHMYISPFSDEDIDKYLSKRFGSNLKFWNTQRKKRAKEIVEKAPNLVVRPMLLAHVDYLLENDSKYEYSFEVYEEMVNRWIDRETEKVPAEGQEAFSKKLYTFSVKLAENLYHNSLKGVYKIDAPELQSFADQHKIGLSEIDMRSKSLLNRDAEGFCKFSHKSILEYFLAQIAIKDPVFEKKLYHSQLSQANKFVDEIKASLEKTKGFLDRLIELSAQPDEGGGDINLTKQDLNPGRLREIKKLTINKFDVQHEDLKGHELTFKGLDGLQELNLKGNKNLGDVGFLRYLPKLNTLDLSYNYRLSGNIGKIKSLKDLEVLNLEECWKINHILPVIRSLDALKVLNLKGCNRLGNLELLAKFKNLIELHISLEKDNLKFLNNLPELKVLNIVSENKGKIKDLSPISRLSQLQSLTLRDCGQEDLSFLQGMTSLRYLNLEACDEIMDFEQLSKFRFLEALSLKDCVEFDNIGHFRYYEELIYLNLKGCYLLRNLNGIEYLSDLEVLNLSGCRHLQDISPLGALKKLQRLDLKHCLSIKPDDVATLQELLPNCTITYSQDFIRFL